MHPQRCSCVPISNNNTDAFSNFPFLTGMLAAEATFDALHEGSDMETYWDALRNSWVWEELYRARNYRPVCSYSLSLSFHLQLVICTAHLFKFCGFPMSPVVEPSPENHT